MPTDVHVVTTIEHPAKCIEANLEAGWGLAFIMRGWMDRFDKWNEIGYTLVFTRQSKRAHGAVETSHGRDKWEREAMGEPDPQLRDHLRNIRQRLGASEETKGKRK